MIFPDSTFWTRPRLAGNESKKNWTEKRILNQKKNSERMLDREFFFRSGRRVRISNQKKIPWVPEMTPDPAPKWRCVRGFSTFWTISGSPEGPRRCVGRNQDLDPRLNRKKIRTQNLSQKNVEYENSIWMGTTFRTEMFSGASEFWMANKIPEWNVLENLFRDAGQIWNEVWKGPFPNALYISLVG